MKISAKASGVSAIVVVLLLAGCQTSRFGGNQRTGIAPAQRTPQVTAEAAINGRWQPTDAATQGVYVAEFRDGVFVSRSPATGNPLAKGSYKVTADDRVELDFVGATTQTRVTAICQRTTPDTLFCQPSTGSPFNLQRA